MTDFRVRIVVETTDPFCYIAKRRLEKAIDIYKRVTPGGATDTFTLEWTPFPFDLTAPRGSVPVKEHMAKEYGADRSEAVIDRLRQLGRADGINFTFEGMLGNTCDSHRLIQLAKSKGRETANRVMDELMRSYFEEGGDITSHRMLTTAGEKGGLDRAETERYLAGQEGLYEVGDQFYLELLYGRGSSIPKILIDEKYVIAGLQDVQAFLQAFSQARENKQSSEMAFNIAL